MSRFALAALLAASVGTTLVVAQDHPAGKSYHDKKNNDEHEWNSHEDQAYRMWGKETHHKYKDFNSMKENDRQSYWGWRHTHSDSLLKIEIR